MQTNRLKDIRRMLFYLYFSEEKDAPIARVIVIMSFLMKWLMDALEIVDYLFRARFRYLTFLLKISDMIIDNFNLDTLIILSVYLPQPYYFYR